VNVETDVGARSWGGLLTTSEAVGIRRIGFLHRKLFLFRYDLEPRCFHSRVEWGVAWVLCEEGSARQF